MVGGFVVGLGKGLWQVAFGIPATAVLGLLLLPVLLALLLQAREWAWLWTVADGLTLAIMWATRPWESPSHRRRRYYGRPPCR